MKRFAVATTFVASVIVVFSLSSTARAGFNANFESYTDGSALTAQGWTGFGAASTQPVSVLGEGHDGTTAFGLAGIAAQWTSGVNVGAFIAHGQSFNTGDTILLTADMMVDRTKASDTIAVARIGFTNAGLAETGQTFDDVLELNRQANLTRISHRRDAAGSTGGGNFLFNRVDYTDADTPIINGEWVKLTMSHIVGGATTVEVRSYEDLSTLIFGNTGTQTWGDTGDNFDAIVLWGRDGGSLDNISVSVISASGPDGDYNNDLKVDAADYVMWRKNVGQPKGTLPHDSSSDDPIGSSQYSLWRSNFGSPGSGSGSMLAAQVPEPSTLLIIAIGACAPLSFRRRMSSPHT